MTKTFTYDDVVRYIYSETTESENDLIVEALALDDDLMTFYIDSLEIKSQMNKIIRTPTEKTIGKVLNYSRHFSTKRPAAISF